MTDYAGEQEMEIEALRAILMEDFEDAEADFASGLSTSTSGSSSRWYKVIVSPKGDDEDEPTEIPVRLALYFAHTPTYPDEKPRISAKSLQNVRQADVEEIQRKLEEEAESNLGMAMVYTLVTTAKEWLREKYGQKEEEDGEEEEAKEEVIEAHGLPVTMETFLEWRERHEAEQALERAKLLPDSALASKEKRMSGREWFALKALKGTAAEVESEGEDDEEEVDFDEDYEDDDFDEEELLDHYLENEGK